MGVALLGPGVYIPPDVLTNADLETLVDTSDEWIFQRTGIRERRISFQEGVKSMGALAAKDLLSKTGVNPKDVDEIIFATNRHDKEMTSPVHAGHVAHAIGARQIPIHDSMAGCTGLVYAIREAHNNIVANDVDTVLVVGVELLSAGVDYSDRDTCILFGDGAGAYLVQRYDGVGIIKNVVGGEPDLGGEGWPNGYLTTERKKGLTIFARQGDKLQTTEMVRNYLVMNGKQIFKFATRVMKQAVSDVLEDTGYTLEEVDVIIPHGANIRITDAAQKGLRKMGFKGVVYTNLERFGNTSTASIPLAAAEAKERGIIEEGKLVINVAFGAGFTYGANLYKAV